VPIGEPADDGVPETLQFRLDERTALMLIPTGGFAWVLGNRDIAPSGVSEVMMSMAAGSAEEVSTVVGRMRREGGEVLAEPTQQDWGFAGVAADPDGHAWQIIAGAEWITSAIPMIR